ncbi:tRNA (adenosine(37)-N6)-threonylcarbamoyltransferase complex ATPase subunit type 1 TsaE [Heliorestis acidaminivorans]|uniref:tRNA threonylcarbamoyladenosine biosynthesis protein TsaE n=1 Tax=Heliorestis acidaminivorans TaxID=553427 RepID=A0A6I0EYL9_9FIRM|nr:tRNA (adenosine(37)-N6)-threonylcarbamoyltransferase complex ATPase subunit type 1 TsaE [Heliorestis acidaminivorans]KAB2951843.1 tRNA (adenosine(37)-N6)-threonylcarbamoyltransferase complex ATPase subunit type 1 TsaE [Heliorestis acidaminivorans]
MVIKLAEVTIDDILEGAMILHKEIGQGLLPDEEATRAFGQWLAQHMKKGDIILLYGDLGAGKTTLVQGLLTSLGYGGAVTSPTFTLVHEYEADLPVFHFDLYRLTEPDQVWDIGWADYLKGEGLLCVEWPERLGHLKPLEALSIKLEPVEMSNGQIGRQVELTGVEESAQAIVREWKKACTCLD